MTTKKQKETNTGWVCPRCGSVNSPDKDKCQCKPQVKEDVDTRELLVEG